LIKPLLCLMFSFGLARQVVAAECTMNPVPIDVARIAREPAIKSYVVDKKRLALTALLKNGRAFKLVHMGCAHSGAMAALWSDSTLPLSEPKAWFTEIVHFARMAFAPGVASDIGASLKSGKVETTTTEDRIVIDAAPSTFMRYTVTIDSAEEGILMTITYSLG
jgi:hypothetical protein